MHPTVFYKYATLDTSTKILATGRLRWSDPRIFNDLTEFQRVPRFDTTLQDSLARLPRVYVDAVYSGGVLDEARLTDLAMQLLTATREMKSSGLTRDEALSLLESLPARAESPDNVHAAAIQRFTQEHLLDGARVLCLTTDATNLAMWDHYAGQHTGCVLGFRHIPEKSTPLIEAREVRYEDDMSSLGSALNFLLYGENDALTKNSVDGVVYTKGRDYSFEREWRVVTWRKGEIGASFGDYPFLDDELESVTFGARLTAASESELRALLAAKYRAARLYRVVADAGAIRRVRQD